MKPNETDQSLSDGMMEIASCLTCPDSSGFILVGDEIELDEPSCDWYGRDRGVSLPTFPFVPSWCPRRVTRPGMIVTSGDPETACRKRQCWENLGEEATLVLKALLTLPEDFLKTPVKGLIRRKKRMVKAFISDVVRRSLPGHRRANMADKVYDELREFTREMTA